MADSRPYALWLVPEPPIHDRLRGVIDGLAAKFGVTPFDPHVTLASGQARSDPPELRSQLASEFAAFQPIEFEMVELRSTRDRFTALHLAVHSDEFESRLARALRVFPTWRGPRVGAHLSLLYVAGLATEVTMEAGKGLVAQVPARLRCDRLALAWPESGDWDDIASWRCEPFAGAGFNAVT